MANRDDYLRRKQQSDSETDLLASLVFDILSGSVETKKAVDALREAVSGRRQFDERRLLSALESVARMSRDDARILAKKISEEHSISRKESRKSVVESIQTSKDTTQAVDSLKTEFLDAMEGLRQEVASKREEPIPVEVTVDVPKIDIPEIRIPKIEVPEVKVPEIDITPLVKELREALLDVRRQQMTSNDSPIRESWRDADFTPIIDAIKSAVSASPNFKLPLDSDGRVLVSGDRQGGAFPPGIAKDKTLQSIHDAIKATESKQDEIIAALPEKNASGSTIIGNAQNKFRDGFALVSPDPAIWDVAWANQADSLVNQGGDAAGASYLRISMSPYTPGSEFEMTSKEMFEFPVRAGYGLSISQRIVGQEVQVSLVGCDADGVVDEISAVSDLAIAGTITIASNVATINFASQHGLKGGDRVVLFGNTESRLNVGPVVVTVVTSLQITVPCTLANGTYTAGGYVAWADPLGYAMNAVGLLYENATATNASFVARRNGAKFRTVNSTVSTTVALQSNTSPYTDAFNAAGDMELMANMEEVMYGGKASDGIAAATGSGRYTQGLPDEGKFYKLRLRVKNLPNMTKIVGKITAITKAGTTTFTVTTGSPHGLVTGQFCQIYGVRDQTNFANITTAVAVTVLDANRFTIVGAGTGTASSAGGIVVLNQGSVTLPGAISLAIQSIARTNNILTVSMNTTAAGLLPGEYCELAGMDGSGAAYDGSYKVLRMTGSTYELESVGANVGSISCGGAVVKRTDVRLNYIKLLDYTRMIMEIAQGRGITDASRALPVVPVSLPTLGTCSAVTKAGLDAQAVTDVASAALTSTATSAAIAMTNIQACAFGVAVTA
ncbi:MAG: hypothetical protein HGA33_00770, partial [Candidatus Moranbacteria bacterium]|nr:hypothetical protein [Candidatus Moranbacteria bacterium]